MSKQMLELADRITNHLVTLASTNMKLSLTEWGIISNDILSAVATLRSSAVSVQTARCARCDGDQYISVHENLPDEPCPVCNSGAPSGADRIRASAAGTAPQTARPPVDITGWKLMPDEPTEAMWQAGREADINPRDSYSKVWRAMWQAAPEIEDCETRCQAVCAPKVPWKGSLSVDLRKGALAVNANGVTLIDEAGTCWAIVFPDKNGFYDHAATIAAALSRPERSRGES